MQDTRTGRIFGFVFLLAVAGAVVLLIAGLGVPVGVGALVGLILGFVAGMLGVLWALRGWGRSVSFAGMEWSSDTLTARDQANTDPMTEMRELTEVQGIDLGTIRAVHPALQTVETNGLTVQLVTLVEREAGMTLDLDVRVGVGVRPPASMAKVSVTDNLGTTYRSSAAGQFGSPSHMQFGVSVIPALPPNATRLEVQVERFVDPFDRHTAEQAGPWAFSIDLVARVSDATA